MAYDGHSGMIMSPVGATLLPADVWNDRLLVLWFLCDFMHVCNMHNSYFEFLNCHMTWRPHASLQHVHAIISSLPYSGIYAAEAHLVHQLLPSSTSVRARPALDYLRSRAGKQSRPTSASSSSMTDTRLNNFTNLEELEELAKPPLLPVPVRIRSPLEELACAQDFARLHMHGIPCRLVLPLFNDGTRGCRFMATTSPARTPRPRCEITDAASPASSCSHGYWSTSQS